MSSVCIHIFRRDYRLDDNTTLIEACKTHDIVIPIFIFTEKQISKSLNPYRSDNCVQFLCESLKDLDNQLKHNHSQLYIFYVKNAKSSFNELPLLETFIKLIPNLKTISFNMDYTKYSQERDKAISDLANSNNIKCLTLDDICLNPIGSVVTGSGKPYTKYTPYWRASSKKDIRKPIKNNFTNYLTNKTQIDKTNLENILTHKVITNGISKSNKTIQILSIEDIMKPEGIILNTINKNLPENGGRENGLNILNNMKEWKDYDEKRDTLAYNTTHLSPFNKFGCVSIREVYWNVINKFNLKKENDHALLRQLFWRDFFYNLSHFYPETYKEKALNPKYRNIKWATDASSNVKFKAWCEGKTGYPIVDACMREINTNGYMHNRGRLIVSNFLCRILQIDWRKGEMYFATKLYDYDPAQNNFGWQVSGSNSSGTTSRPLSQTIMSPWVQGVNFDNKGVYIKKWCPELESVESSHLHKWDQFCDMYIKEKGVNYIKPIVDFNIEKAKSMKLYTKYLL